MYRPILAAAALALGAGAPAEQHSPGRPSPATAVLPRGLPQQGPRLARVAARLGVRKTRLLRRGSERGDDDEENAGQSNDEGANEEEREKRLLADSVRQERRAAAKDLQLKTHAPRELLTFALEALLAGQGTGAEVLQKIRHAGGLPDDNSRIARRGTALHAYCEKLLAVLRWMQQHAEKLRKQAEAVKSGDIEGALGEVEW